MHTVSQWLVGSIVWLHQSLLRSIARALKAACKILHITTSRPLNGWTSSALSGRMLQIWYVIRHYPSHAPFSNFVFLQAVRLREFQSQSHRFVGLLEASSLMNNLDPTSEAALWAMIDYGTLGADPRKKPLFSESGLSNMPSPTSWGLDAVSASFNGPHSDIFSPQPATMRLNEVEYFVNDSPGQNCLL